MGSLELSFELRYRRLGEECRRYATVRRRSDYSQGYLENDQTEQQFRQQGCPQDACRSSPNHQHLPSVCPRKHRQPGKEPRVHCRWKGVDAAFEFMVSNIGEPQVLRRVLANRPFEKYFVDYLSIPQQLEDTTRYVIEALDEELGARFTPITRNVWKRAFNFANSIMAESFQ